METVSKPQQPDNAEESVKCPSCGAMINVGGVMGRVTCPVCGANLDSGEMQIFGASNEGF